MIVVNVEKKAAEFRSSSAKVLLTVVITIVNVYWVLPTQTNYKSFPILSCCSTELIKP